MAIEPFRQKIGIPDAPRGTDARVGQIDSLGPTITEVGGQILKVAEPYAERAAIKAGVADFAATGIGKDHDGNYVLPKAQEGGIVYAAAFNKVAEKEYLIHVQNDGESALTAHYTDPTTIGQTPMQKLAGAQAIVDGIVQGAAPELRGEVYEGLSREVRQRDLAENNFYYRKQYELKVNTFGKQLKDSYEKGSDAASQGGSPDVVAQTAVHLGEAMEAGRSLVAMGEMSEWELAQIPITMQSYAYTGTVKGEWRDALAAGTLDSTDNALMAQIVRGNAPTGSTLLGHSMDDFRGLDAKAREKLAQDIDSGTSPLRQAEEEQRRADAADEVYETASNGGGFPIGMSSAKQIEATVDWANKVGIDPLTPNGAIQVFTHFGAMPEGFYKDVFKGVSTKGTAQIESLYGLYGTLKNMLGPDGSVDITEANMSVEDSSFLYHYANAKLNKASPAEAQAQALAAVANKLSVEPTEITAYLRKVSGLDIKNGKDQLGDKIDDFLGVEWTSLNALARDSVSLEIAQRVAMGVPWQDAAGLAGQRFKNNWVHDNVSLDSALSPTSYVPKINAVPRVQDVQTRQMSGDWSLRAIDAGLKAFLGEQVIPGIPGLKDLKAGKNVFAKSSGRTAEGGGRLFELYYYDKAKQSGIARLVDKNGDPLTLDLGKAAKFQQDWSQSYVKAKDAAIGRIAKAGQQVIGMGRLEQIGAGLIAGVTGAPGITPKPTPEAEAELRAAQRDYVNTFGDLPGTIKLPAGIDMRLHHPGEKKVDTAPKRGPNYKAPFPTFDPEDMRPPALISGMREARRNKGVTADAKAGTKSYATPQIEQLAQQRGLTESVNPRELIRRAARIFQISPHELAAIIDRESNFKPTADNGTHQGLFQAGREERITYKIDKTSTWAAQLNALVSFATDRGFKPGMGWKKLYTTINGGNPHVKVTESDGNGTQLDHYAYIQGKGMRNARRFMAGG
jgi:hypothetical protein